MVSEQSSFVAASQNQVNHTRIEVDKEFQEQEKNCESASESASDENSERSTCNCKPILVADDNEFNLFTLQQILLGYKLEADGACNGKEAADMVK